MVLLERRDREIADDCDLIGFGLLISLGFKDDVVEPYCRTMRICWHCESCGLHLLCCPLAEMSVAGLPQITIVGDGCIFFSLI